LTDFSISTNLLKVSLLQGETKRKLIEIENTGTSALNLQIDLENLKDFLIFQGGVSKYSLTLKPGEKQNVQLIFNVAKDYKPGVYPGRIIVKSPITQRIITAIVEVESARKIFDVDVKIQNKIVVRGNDLIAEISIFNLGKDSERVDTQVEVGIKDFDGNIIQKQDSRIAVQTQASFTQSILIPRYLEEGKYIAYAVVTFDHEIGTASEIFEVVSRPSGFFALSTLWMYIIPGFISIIIILIVLLELKHHYRKRGFAKESLIPEKIGKKLIKKGEEIDINRLLRDVEGGVIHGSHKKILEVQLRVLKQNYELGLINYEDYLKSKDRLEKKLNKIK